MQSRRTTTTRVTRTSTRLANENAVAQSTTVTTRSKTQVALKPSTSTTAVVPGKSRAMAPTAASKAKAVNKKENVEAVKRKRDALTEGTKQVANKGKGKAKATETEVAKPVTRQPLATVAGSGIPVRRVTRSTARAVQKDVKVETRVPVILAREEKPRSPVFTRPEPPKKRPSAALEAVDDEEDPEERRAHKRPHTSAPDVPVAHDIANNTTIEIEDVAVMLCVPPRGQLWDDLDAEDFDDPAMVSEYVVDIFDYLKEVELTTLPNPRYMARQLEIDYEKRGILVDWLIQVHKHFKLLPETLFLCVNLIDRFLSAREIAAGKFQLVGLTAFFVACKFEETLAPSVEEMVYLSGGQYTTQDLFRAERFMLRTLDWNMSYPNPMGFLRRISKADDLNTEVRTVGKYLMEIACVEFQLVATPPSLLAAAAMWLGRLVLGREEWTHNLEHYSSYKEEEVIPVANIMINYVLSDAPHVHLYTKYAAKRFMKVSVYVQQWALSHWPEASRVVLADHLPMLKAEALELRIRLEEEEALQAEAAL